MGEHETETEALTSDELLVEEVSIDGMCGVYQAVPTELRGVTFDLDRAWRVDPRVSMRPEPFGALLYHFGTRRLSFLKNQTVLAVVRSLADHPSARSACLASGVPQAELPAYARALGALADSNMISERTLA